MKASLETSNGICVTFYKRFDPAIAEVPHEPGQSFPARRLLGEESKSYALDLPAHEIPSSHDHRVNSWLLIISDRSHAPAGGHLPYGAARTAEEGCRFTTEGQDQGPARSIHGARLPSENRVAVGAHSLLGSDPIVAVPAGFQLHIRPPLVGKERALGSGREQASDLTK